MNEMRYDGVCPICETRVTFAACSDWYRDTLLCTSCEGGSLPRERALALALARHQCAKGGRVATEWL